MTQQINLFARLPKIKAEQHVVSNTLLRNISLVALGGFVVLLLLQSVAFFLSKHSMRSLQAKQDSLQTSLNDLQAKYPEETKLAVEKQGAQIQEEITAKNEMVAFMKTQLDDITGFSDPLEALANQITTGVWLVLIEIDYDKQFYHFNGNAFEVDQVLAFISNLGKDTFFTGKDFKVFEVSQANSDENYISFTLATE